MIYFDAACGIAGFSKGIEEAHPEWKCSGACDIDEAAAKIYKRHFPGVKVYGDIRDVEKLPDGTELLCAGFPCQSFSHAGKRRGFADPRGIIFFEIARLAGTSKPRYLLLENVEGLLHHEGGKTFQTILRTLHELGYDAEWSVLNSADYGLAQNRERVYIIGHLREGRGPEIFPLPREDCAASGSIETASSGCRAMSSTAKEFIPQGERIYVAEGKSPALCTQWTPKVAMGAALRSRANEGKPELIEVRKDGLANTLTTAHKDSRVACIQENQRREVVTKKISGTLHCSMHNNQAPKVLIEVRSEEGRAARRLNLINGRDHTPFRSKLITTREDGRSNCLTTSMHIEQMLTDGRRIRYLTPTEFERLQGFPDGWTAGQADHPRYKQLGNAVSVPVVKAIMERFQ